MFFSFRITIFITPVKWRVEFFRLNVMFLLTRISTSLKYYLVPSGAANEGSIKTAPRGCNIQSVMLVA